MKKRIRRTALAAVFAASMLFLQTPVPDVDYSIRTYAEEEADDTEYISGNYKYKILESGEAEITGCTMDNYELNVDIPAQIDGHPVVSIGESAFRYKYITSLKLPNGLREIKNYAFYGKIYTSVEIPETVTSISEYAFDFMDIHGGYHFAIPNTLAFNPGNEFNGMLLKYHSENGGAVIDDINSDHVYRNLYVPETICSLPVRSVLAISGGSANIRAVFCKDGVALPNVSDKILVRYTPDGSGCRITAVTGSAPDVTLNLVDDINGRTLTGISGITAHINAIAVPKDITDSLNVSFPVIYCRNRGNYLNAVKISMNGAQRLDISNNDLYIYTAFLSEDIAEKVTFSYNYSFVIYGETNGGVEIRNITFNSFDNQIFIPTVIDGKSVIGFSDSCPKDFSSLGSSTTLYLPSNMDSDEIKVVYKYTYIENSGSVSVTGTITGNHWGSGGAYLEDIFGMPIDTVTLQSGLDYGMTYDKDKNTIRFNKDSNGNWEITEIRQGKNTSTVTIPETIGGIPVSGISPSVRLENVDSIIVPESIADTVPSGVDKVEYIIDEDGNFVITEVTGDPNVKFPESIGGKSVDTVIVSDDIKDKVDVPETSNRITYTENEDGTVTATVQVGKGKEKASVPDEIGGKEVDTVIAEDGSNVDVPRKADKITYTEDEDGNVTVTDVQTGEGKGKTTIPDEINGKEVDTVVVKQGTNVDVPETADKIIYTEDENGNITIEEIILADNRSEDKPVKLPDTIGGKVPGFSDEAKGQLKNIRHEHRYDGNGICSACGEKDPNRNEETDPGEDGTNSDTETPPAGGNYPSGGGSTAGTTSGITVTSSEQLLIAEIANAAEGDTITFEIKSGSTALGKAVFDAMAGRDITLIIKLRNGVYWNINGKDIERSQKVDLGVTLNTKFASDDEITELAGDKKTVSFSLNHNGDLGFTGLLDIPVNKSYNGQYENLYRYGKNGFEFVISSKISDGYAEFVFSHASDYLIVIDTNAYGDDVSSATGIYAVSDIVENVMPVVGFIVPIAVSLTMILRKRPKASK